MKTPKFIAALAAALILAAGMFSADAQSQQPRRFIGGPGPAISEGVDSIRLPEAAITFLNKHFQGEKISQCNKYFAGDKYEVELADGIDIEFNTDGKVMEIDAPDNTFLAPTVVKDLLHANAFSRLEKDSLATKVESVEFDKRGRAVEVEVSIPEPDVYIFDIDGNFIALSD